MVAPNASIDANGPRSGGASAGLATGVTVRAFSTRRGAAGA